MRKALSPGTLWWLHKEMPQALQDRLDEELRQLDRERQERRKAGDTKIVSLVNHFRYVTEHQADLRDIRAELFDVLTFYFPMTRVNMRTNKLPSQVDCQYFWARELARLEKEPTKSIEYHGLSKPALY